MTHARTLTPYLFVLLILPGIVIAQSAGPLVVPPTPLDHLRVEAPPRLADRMDLASLAQLKPARIAAVDQLDAMQEWNLAGRLPAQNGFARPLPLPQRVTIDGSRATATPVPWSGGLLGRPDPDRLVWVTRVEVEDAHRLRLHLSNVRLPRGAKLWVYGDHETRGPFGAELINPEGDLWTPSVAGPSIHLEVVLPSKGPVANFELDQVVEIFQPDAGLDTRCLIDGQCADSEELDFLDLYRRAVAQLTFVKNGKSAFCTGGLLNDKDDSTVIPYLLTANHCISSQTVASSLEAFFDFHPAVCLGAPPAKGSLPRTVGATLLATGADSDFTLLRLPRLVPNRLLLGWNANPSVVDGGTILYRLSHPGGLYQAYSRTRVYTAGGPICVDAPRPQFLYSSKLDGSTAGGSSGGPVILEKLQIVGQLLGGCGPNRDDNCDVRNATVDGAFSTTFPIIQRILDPEIGSDDPCVSDSETLCLSDDRFEVTVSWETTDGDSGEAGAVALTEDTGYFWFFSDSNVELVVKVLNACSFSNRIWVFAGGLTNVRTVVTVRDTEAGTTKTYVNPQSTPFQPIQDTDAFATCP